MKRVIGLGGVFFKSEDPKKLHKWYSKHLGVKIEDFGGTVFNWQNQTEEVPNGYSLCSIFDANTDYLNPSKESFMINFVVDDMDALLPKLKEEKVELVGEPMDDKTFGKFAWILDPEGRKIELWEPPKKS